MHKIYYIGILFCAFVLGIYYGFYPLLGHKVFDLTRGLITINTDTAIFNLILSVVALIYIYKNKEANKYKKSYRSKNNEYINLGLYIIVIFLGLYDGVYSMFGFETFKKYHGFVQNTSYEAIANILIALLLLVYLHTKQKGQKGVR